MLNLVSELSAVEQNSYQLRFAVPTTKQLENMRRIHRDMTEMEIAKHTNALKGLEHFLALIESGDLPPESLPPEVRKRLQSAARTDDDGE
jgi:superfamily I DNA and RNA helicase